METVRARAARRRPAGRSRRSWRAARWRPDPESVSFTGNGRQALAATLAALVPAGQRLGVEALSYQSVTGIAARLGVEVVPLPMDEHGLRADGVIAAAPSRSARARSTCSRRCTIRSGSRCRVSAGRNWCGRSAS